PRAGPCGGGEPPASPARVARPAVHRRDFFETNRPPASMMSVAGPQPAPRPPHGAGARRPPAGRRSRATAPPPRPPAPVHAARPPGPPAHDADPRGRRAGPPSPEPFPAAFDEFAATPRRDLAPATPLERVLADRVTLAAWRLPLISSAEARAARTAPSRFGKA